VVLQASIVPVLFFKKLRGPGGSAWLPGSTVNLYSTATGKFHRFSDLDYRLRHHSLITGLITAVSGNPPLELTNIASSR
jgi:hypothetical protein